MKFKSRIVTFSVSLLIWVLLTFTLDIQHVVTGILVSLLVSAMMGDMFTNYAYKWANPRRYRYLLELILVFCWECFKANIDVAIMVLHPHLPINPGVVKIKTNLKSETALTFLANCITLTPGTFSVDIDRGNGYIYIHWINVQTQDIQKATEIISSKFERLAKEVFE